jgi:hypothetical protein
MLSLKKRNAKQVQFAGVKSIRKDVYDFALSHYRVSEDSDEVHGYFYAKGQEGFLTHYHTFEPSVGYGDYVVLRLNTILFENVSDETAALEFVNALNSEFAHSQALSHCIYYPDEKTIASSSQTMLVFTSHNFLHDVISNHILNNKWFINFANSPVGLAADFGPGVRYASNSEIAH